MKPTDAELVDLAHAGDHAAFGVLTERYRLLVERQAKRLMDDREAAVDCVQATFVRAWERLSQLRENDRFGSWLLAICRTVAANMRVAESVRREREAVAIPFHKCLPDVANMPFSRDKSRKP